MLAGLTQVGLLQMIVFGTVSAPYLESKERPEAVKQNQSANSISYKPQVIFVINLVLRLYQKMDQWAAQVSF